MIPKISIIDPSPVQVVLTADAFHYSGDKEGCFPAPL
jgi:hypothetical protein